MHNERELIRAIHARAERQGIAGGRLIKLAIGDDCALLRPPRGGELAITTDLTLEDVHFRRDWHPPESVGHRCLARGLSDLASMGARPEAAFLSIALPRELGGRWFNGFLDGWMRLAAVHGVTLAGGDTAEAPRGWGGRPGIFAADVVLVGSIPASQALRRAGARAGDILYVTGTLGAAAAELRALAMKPMARRKRDAEKHPHLYPEPRLKAGARLMRSRMATAAIDLSDGLSTDLTHLCEASKLHAVVEQDALPIAPGATLKEALHGGEDYELLFTARPETYVPAKLSGVPVRAIGRMIGRASRRRIPGSAESRIELRAGDGSRTPLRAGGWEHFRNQGKRDNRRLE